MDHEEAVTVLLAYMFSGAVGHAEGKCVSYSHLSTTPATSTWIAALEDEDSDVEGIPINRFRLDINRHSRAVVAHKLIALSDSDLADCILIATGHRLESAARSADGSFSISYKISVHEDPELQYIVQLRFHADVTSMNLLMQHISSTVDPNVLPLPQVFPIPNEQARQQQTGVGRQIARWVDGQMAHSIYPSLPHESRLVLVRDIARAYEALWDLPLPQGATNRPLIGELRANVNEETGETVLDVGPERHYSLGGPFTSTRDYLRGHIRFSLAALEKQEGIEEYKDRHLARIKAFVETGMPDISAIVEDPAGNLFGPEYPGADELREAFWSAIPKWNKRYEQDSTKVFLEWWDFAEFLKAEAPFGIDDGDVEAKWKFWSKNVEVVEGMLDKYGRRNLGH